MAIADQGGAGDVNGSSGFGPVQLAVSPADLAQFDQTVEAQRIARLEADMEVVLRLSVEGFSGPTWELLARALAEYGWAVLSAWIGTGLVHAKCREKGLRLPAPAPWFSRLSPDLSREMAQEVVGNAIVDFRDKVLRTGRWEPRRGASLATFFVGNCLIHFANVYRSWNAERTRAARHVPLDPTSSYTSHEFTDPQTQFARLESDDRVAEILAPIPDETNRAILKLVADDYSIDEIADILGMSGSQVQARLYRARVKLKESTNVRSA